MLADVLLKQVLTSLRLASRRYGPRVGVRAAFSRRRKRSSMAELLAFAAARAQHVNILLNLDRPANCNSDARRRDIC